MLRSLVKSKVHRATVTEADLNYVGSITIDEALMEAADIVQYEWVHVWNLNNGERLETYAIKGKRHSGEICANGAAARLLHVGDKVIIASSAMLTPDELRDFKPKMVFVDEENRVDKVLDFIESGMLYE